MIRSWIKIIISFIYIGIIATLALISAPFKRTGNFFHKITKLFASGTLKICGVQLNVEGTDNLDPGQHYVYISNHASQFDIPAIIAGIPDKIRIIYKKELEKIPIFGWALKYNKIYISIDRKHGQSAIQSLEEAAEKIKKGESVLLFAEGTRSPDGNLQPFKRGPFKLAILSGVPVVPVTIVGSHKILPKNSLRIRSGTITIKISEPIYSKGELGKESEIDLLNRVHTAIKNNL